MRPTDPRRRLTRLLARHRRTLAAILAGAGVLLALTSLREAPAAEVESAQRPAGLARGEVAVPVVLASLAIARTLEVGDVIDVVGLTRDEGGDPHASVVAARTRVLEVPDSAGTLGASASAVVLLAVRESDALALSEASAEGPVSVYIRTRSMTG